MITWWMILAMWGFSTFILVLFSHRVEIACERAPGGGTCVIRSQTPLSSGDPRRVPIAEVENARLEVNDDASRVTLRTKSGDVPLTDMSESSFRDEKAAVVSEVNHFLGDPGAQRVIASYGSRWAGYVTPWIIMTAILVGLGYFTRKIRVIVNYAEGEVRIERPTFPWGRKTEALELGDVTRAVIQESTDSDGATFRIALIQTDGTAVPLTSTYDSVKHLKLRAIKQINAALAERG